MVKKPPRAKTKAKSTKQIEIKIYGTLKTMVPLWNRSVCMFASSGNALRTKISIFGSDHTQEHHHVNTAQSKRCLLLSKRWSSGLVANIDETKERDYQVPLPKLPVPELQKTMDTYLELAEVVASAQQVKHTTELVRDFMDHQGPRLQEVLLERQRDMDNWATQWWLNDMFLKVRYPLPFFSNPAAVYPRRSFTSSADMAELAAQFADAMVEYKEMLDSDELPTESTTSLKKGQPMCMDQYHQIVGGCRIPEVGTDRLELPHRNGLQEEELIVAACRNHFYPIMVKTADHGRFTLGEIQSQLVQCMEDAARAPPAPKVGLLTSMFRDDWAMARKHLIKDDNNRKNLELISRSLCLVCLDQDEADRADLDADVNDSLRMFHGGGTRFSAANRWFDKTIQYIVSSNGANGLSLEHAPAEGVPSSRLSEAFLARLAKAARPVALSVLPPAPRALRWSITTEVQQAIDKAGRDFDRLINDIDNKIYRYQGYGRDFMKACGTSPDVYCQLAIQLAYYKMYGRLVSTHETATLRRFRGGRVESVRSAHGAALAWAQAMCTEDTTLRKEEHLQLFYKAVRKQTSSMEASLVGRGIDNHLLGLKQAALETTGQLPPLFTDETYNAMMEFRLCTSQVPTIASGIFASYGPMSLHGYGLSYTPQKDSIIFCVASLASSAETDTEGFSLALESALDHMKLMLSP